MKDLGGYAVVQFLLRFVAQLHDTKNQGRRDNTSAGDFRSLPATQPAMCWFLCIERRTLSSSGDELRPA